ncbi:putative nf-x1 finger and helicase domain protein [Erysiphe necator]|uniref:Putative nf-x1 finger and helicase domain protein n=1 Tax=Uncinula necator TaxID=52586 RepID=A0A0B1PBB1_UNCNE|nr:putative nf-x1 finger and helicase domain protein [Erysiphe necator]
MPPRSFRKERTKIESSHHGCGKNWIANNEKSSERNTKSDTGQVETSEAAELKHLYYNWKRMIKSKPNHKNNPFTIKNLWDNACKILDGKNLELKTRVPEDLESTELFGREHITLIMELQAHDFGLKEYINLMHSFLKVVTHDVFLHCISVDTAVGGIYKFISGTNGTRAVLFFQHLCSSIINFLQCDSNLEYIDEILIEACRALQELLRREQKIPFNEDLPKVFGSIEDILEKSGTLEQSQTYQIVNQIITELRDIVNQAIKIIGNGKNDQSSRYTKKVVVSAYPKSIIGPQNRHDNDKLDISEIKILPTYEEIISEYTDFLPSTNLQVPHFIEERGLRHLDTHFRLLRHDILGSLKEALGVLISAIQKDPSQLEKSQLGLNNQIRVSIYSKVRVSSLSFAHKRGLELQISFPQPLAVKNKNLSQRKKWWLESRRLEQSTFLCLICCESNEISLLYLNVTEKSFKESQETLISSEYFATIKTRLVSEDEKDIKKLISVYMANLNSHFLIEIPCLMLATFVPTLKRLQDMYRLNSLPFRQWILSESTNANLLSDVIPPPIYAREPTFSYSLRSIQKHSIETEILVKPAISMGDEDLIEQIIANTLLDCSQAKALVCALCQEFVQIQGPPGTGKSFLGLNLMQVLLDIPSKYLIGPIIVVCYTNHALDQFLENLLKFGVHKIIRVGAQSKVEELQEKNLKVVAKTNASTKYERYRLYVANDLMEKKQNPVTQYLNELKNIRTNLSWNSVKTLLAEEYPKIYEQLQHLFADEYQFVQFAQLDPFDLWLQEDVENFEELCKIKDPTIPQLLELANKNIYSISNSGRRKLKDFWTFELQEKIADNLLEGFTDYKTAKQERSKILNEVERRVLQDAQVIGVTFSGFAGNIDVLQHVKAKVLFCEEAGEVLEAHFLTALLPSIEHVISIGDHMQLRPTINNFGLSLENSQGMQYQLDRSLFERLSLGENGVKKLPMAQLYIQRRMRPGISNLIKEIYPNLADHESVKDLPDIIGLRNNIFFLDHKNLEENKSEHGNSIKSYTNLWEIDMIFALVRHLVLQGSYNSGDIAVLTPYGGQLQKLRSKFQSEFEIILSDQDQELVKNGLFVEDNEHKDILNKESLEIKPSKKNISNLIRIATVDNFQGEEAKVVIVSLVRSNKEKKVGFLKTRNRINVLLSRAKHGLYLIGNADTYSRVPMWTRVIDTLKVQNSFGTSFNLCCPRHKSTPIKVESPLDFEKYCPEGGCKLMCELRLDCGHKCMARCHFETMHKIFKCHKPCERLHSPCKHACKKSCGEKCGLCQENIQEYTLPCGHKKNNVSCQETLTPEKIFCEFKLEKKSPGCGHIVTLACSDDVSLPSYRCIHPCKQLLSCGHHCIGTCGGCESYELGTRHEKCTKICGRPLSSCNHRCEKACHDGEECGACSKPCQIKCGHSRCPLLCHKTCAPCVEPCVWENCEHIPDSCQLPCAAPCIRVPCQMRCTKLLTTCGHQCPSLCGEVCPEEYCQSCSSKKDARVDLILLRNFDEINLDEDPIIVLSCGHFFTAESLDGIIGMSDVYETDKFGNYIKPKEVSEFAGSIPTCPDCKSPICQYTTKRYNRVINRAVLDEMSRKFLVSGQNSLKALERNVRDFEEELDKSICDIEEILDKFSNETDEKIFALIIAAQLKGLTKSHKISQERLSQKIKRFQSKFAEDNKPAKKLHDASIKMIKEKDLAKRFPNLNFEESRLIPSQDRRITVGAKILELDFRRVVLSYQINLFKTVKKSQFFYQNLIDLPKFGSIFDDCQALFGICLDDNLPRLAVQCTIYFGQLARHYQSFTHSNDSREERQIVNDQAKKLLTKGQELCLQPFQGSSELAIAIDETLKILGHDWYQEVTKEELETIKRAMVTGPGGIATHSGHWYKCELGHPFAIGECGMPMELARCPECGSNIGGQNHQAVAGVTRAEEME